MLSTDSSFATLSGTIKVPKSFVPTDERKYTFSRGVLENDFKLYPPIVNVSPFLRKSLICFSVPL